MGNENKMVKHSETHLKIIISIHYFKLQFYGYMLLCDG